MNPIYKSACALLLMASTLCPTLLGCAAKEIVTTTVATTELPLAQTPDHAELLAENTYAAVGETLMMESIRKYSSKRSQIPKMLERVFTSENMR